MCRCALSPLATLGLFQSRPSADGIRLTGGPVVLEALLQLLHCYSGSSSISCSAATNAGAGAGAAVISKAEFRNIEWHISVSVCRKRPSSVHTANCVQLSANVAVAQFHARRVWKVIRVHLLARHHTCTIDNATYLHVKANPHGRSS